MGVSAVVAIAGVYSASQQAEAAKSAAETQASAGRAAVAGQQQALTQQQALQEPFRTAGMTALDRLVQGTQPGGEFAKPFSMAESPAQQFATKEALAAMQSQMATGGQALSSNAIIGAGKLAGDIGAQYESQAFNQWLASQQQAMSPLEFLASQGQAAASGQAANVGGAASNISGLQTGIGNVQGAGQIGSANAMAGGISNVSQYLMMQNLLGKTPTTTPTTTPATGLVGTGSPYTYQT